MNSMSRREGDIAGASQAGPGSGVRDDRVLPEVRWTEEGPAFESRHELKNATLPGGICICEPWRPNLSRGYKGLAHYSFAVFGD
jgi:hypothetical protein